MTEHFNDEYSLIGIENIGMNTEVNSNSDFDTLQSLLNKYTKLITENEAEFLNKFCDHMISEFFPASEQIELVSCYFGGDNALKIVFMYIESGAHVSTIIELKPVIEWLKNYY